MTIVEAPIPIVDVVRERVMQVKPSRSDRIRRPVVLNDFVVYLLEDNIFDVGDPINFDEAMKSD